MTKAEFDERFLSGDICVRHVTMEEWDAINQYAVQHGVKKQPGYLHHDCDVFPYAFVDVGSHAMNASTKPHGRDILSFSEFQAITGEDDEMPDMSYADIL